MEIPWELFPSEVDAIGPALDRATAHMDDSGLPYALVMRKGTVAPYPVKPGAFRRPVRRSAAPAGCTHASPRRAGGEAVKT